WVRIIGLAAVFLEMGCFSRAQFDQAHAVRVQQINVEQDGRRAQVMMHAQELLGVIYQRRKYLIEVVPGTGYSPVTRIDAKPEMKKLFALCTSYEGHIQQ